MPISKKRLAQLVDEAGALNATLNEAKAELDSMKSDLKDYSAMAKERKLQGAADWDATVGDSSKKIMDMRAIWEDLICNDFNTFRDLVIPNIKAIEEFCDKNDLAVEDYITNIEKNKYSRITFYRKKKEKPKKKRVGRITDGRKPRMIDM